MTKLKAKLIVVIAAAAIIGATMTTLEATKVFNLATARGPPSGPSCDGCIITRNLANGSVTTPKIAPSAVSIKITKVSSQSGAAPHMPFSEVVQCPSGTVVTGGGFFTSHGPYDHLASTFDAPNGWTLTGDNIGPFSEGVGVVAMCASIQP